MNLQTDTIVDLALLLWDNEAFKTLYNKRSLIVKRVPFYGMLYDRTFGAQEAVYEDDISKLMEMLPDGSHVIECFSGNGFESVIQALKFPKLNFHCLDTQVYERYETAPNVTHHVHDCLDLIGFSEVLKYSNPEINISCVFVGPTNASCIELDYAQMESFVYQCKKVVSKGGLIILSASEPTDDKRDTVFLEDDGHFATVIHSDVDKEYYHVLLLVEGTNTLYVSDTYRLFTHSKSWLKSIVSDKEVISDDMRIFVIKN